MSVGLYIVAEGGDMSNSSFKVGWLQCLGFIKNLSTSKTRLNTKWYPVSLKSKIFLVILVETLLFLSNYAQCTRLKLIEFYFILDNKCIEEKE